MDTITTTKALKRVCKDLAEQPFVTIDTEFLRDTTYWPRLCLVQLAGPDAEPVLVDPMVEDLDLDPLFKLMGNEQVIKVFHAARQDLEIFFNLSGTIPHPVFDTQVAAAVCGFGESISYDQLVRRVTRVDIDKSHRFTDWSRRPLTDKQLRYAAADVTHLVAIYEHLRERLEENGRAHWIQEEMAILTSPQTYRSDPERAWMRLKLRVRKPHELETLKRLAAWRETEAQERDVPRGRIVKDDALYELASQMPDNEQALAHVRALPRGFERSRNGKSILKIIHTVRGLDEKSLPKVPRGERRPQAHPAVVDMLKVLLKQVSEDEGVAARMVATVDEVEAIAADDNAEVPALSGWRREIYGEVALRLKHGQIALAVDKSKLKRIELGKSVK